ncbi:putative ribonuclease H-like domain-containing protein [Tanacetum coccineum]|uniref:Ribonuclease H-like domain-containing protein n=1 Tax=Tanacetum coccineum TaxID=301880 RepID=A0ABQ4YVN2_9ASTR
MYQAAFCLKLDLEVMKFESAQSSGTAKLPILKLVPQDILLDISDNVDAKRWEHLSRRVYSTNEQRGSFRNQDNTRKHGNNEDTSSKAMLAIVVPKDLDKLLGSQITNKSKKGLGYSVVPPPHPLIYNRPKKLDLSYSGLDEFKEPEFKGYGSENSKQESNIVCDQKSDDSKENSDDSLVKEQVSKDTSSFVESSLNVNKETVFPVDKKVESVKPKNHEKPVKKSVRYAEMYRSQTPRGNQRNWNGQKSNQLGKFKNKVMDDFCKEKGIKREYSVAKTPQQNGVAERRNRTIIEAARIMLADSKLPTTFWAEAVSTACYVQSLMNSADASYFDSPTKDVDNGEPKSTGDDKKQDGNGLDNENDKQDKFEDDSSTKEVNTAGQHINTASPEVNTGHFKLNTIGPSVNTASLNDQDSPKDMFKIGASHTLEATLVEFYSDEDELEVDLGNITNSYTVLTTPNTRIHKDHLIKNVIGDVKTFVQTRRMTKPTFEQGFLSAVYEQKTHDTLNTCLYACFLLQIEPTSIAKALSDSSWVEAMQEELLQFKLQ